MGGLDSDVVCNLASKFESYGPSDGQVRSSEYVA